MLRGDNCNASTKNMIIGADTFRDREIIHKTDFATSDQEF
jgi:hypothetical protein